MSNSMSVLKKIVIFSQLKLQIERYMVLTGLPIMRLLSHKIWQGHWVTIKRYILSRNKLIKELQVIVGVSAFCHMLCKCRNKIVDINGIGIARGGHKLLAFIFWILVVMRLRWVNSQLNTHTQLTFTCSK